MFWMVWQEGPVTDHGAFAVRSDPSWVLTTLRWATFAA